MSTRGLHVDPLQTDRLDDRSRDGVTRRVAVAGGGMGGLAAALACARAGWHARVYEQAREFSEVGAGIQLGPNTTRILIGWGLEQALVGQSRPGRSSCGCAARTTAGTRAAAAWATDSRSATARPT